MSGRTRVAVVLAVAGAVLAGGCTAQESRTRAVEHAGRQAAPAHPASAPVAPTPTVRAREEVPVETVPTDLPPTELPPGDPGLDAPSVSDPGRPEHGRDHEEHARTVVPAQALLDAGTVSAVLGGGWEQTSAPMPDCLTGGVGVAERSVTYRSGDDQVWQAVATHDSLTAADDAVGELSRRLSDCGWAGAPDPRLGTASAAASSADGSQTAVLVSAEGVTVALVGSPGATDDRARWASLVDVALGTSCAAAPHGCH